jgi:pimeloyl-ACP methyl ester carboxylesterase
MSDYNKARVTFSAESDDMDLSARVRAWRAEGASERICDREIFVRHTHGEGPLLLFLHGFPSSSFDWRSTLHSLPGRATVTLDFLGFGLSEKPRDVRYSLLDQADLVEEAVAGDPARPTVLVAHDMGTSVATELLARDIDGRLSINLKAALLCNGSMILERASLTPGQKLLRSPLGGLAARASSRRFFLREFSKLFSGAHPLSQEEAEDQWALWHRAGGQRIAHRLISYQDERIRFAARWHGAIANWPGQLAAAWGLLDPVATTNVLAGLRELRPSMPVTELPDVGHYLQIEEPARIAELVDGLARAAASSE